MFFDKSIIIQFIILFVPVFLYWFTVYKHHVIVQYARDEYHRKPDVPLDILFEWIPVINLFHSLEIIMFYCNYNPKENLFERYIGIK